MLGTLVHAYADEPANALVDSSSAPPPNPPPHRLPPTTSAAATAAAAAAASPAALGYDDSTVADAAVLVGFSALLSASAVVRNREDAASAADDSVFRIDYITEPAAERELYVTSPSRDTETRPVFTPVEMAPSGSPPRLRECRIKRLHFRHATRNNARVDGRINPNQGTSGFCFGGVFFFLILLLPLFALLRLPRFRVCSPGGVGDGSDGLWGAACRGGAHRLASADRPRRNARPVPEARPQEPPLRPLHAPPSSPSPPRVCCPATALLPPAPACSRRAFKL